LWGRGGTRRTVGVLACEVEASSWSGAYEDEVLLEVEERHGEVWHRVQLFLGG
jgi:hypothetical protein